MGSSNLSETELARANSAVWLSFFTHIVRHPRKVEGAWPLGRLRSTQAPDIRGLESQLLEGILPKVSNFWFNMSLLVFRVV